MKKRALSLLMAVIMVVSLLPTAVWAAGETLSDGTGAADDPYLIATADDLKAFRDKVNAEDNSTLCAKLTANIDLNNESWTPINSKSGYVTTAYSGTFDGAGHTITNLNVTGNGFFSAVCNATIQNLKVSGSVSGSSVNVGGIVGLTQGSVEIKNCSFSGSVTSSKSTSSSGVGGIVGKMNAGTLTVQNCANHATVTGGCPGGIVGYGGGTSNKLIIENCYNDGTINGKYNSSGICASNTSTNSTITNCYNAGAVSGGTNYAGISANFKGKLSKCYHTKPDPENPNSTNSTGKSDCLTSANLKTTLEDIGFKISTDGKVYLPWEGGEVAEKHPRISISGPNTLQMDNSTTKPKTTLNVEYKDMDDEPTVEWTTTNSDIISLKAPENVGPNNAAVVVTAEKPGTATITATAGEYTADFTIDVVPCFNIVQIADESGNPYGSLAAGQTAQAIVSVYNPGSYDAANDDRLTYRWYWYKSADLSTKQQINDATGRTCVIPTDFSGQTESLYLYVEVYFNNTQAKKSDGTFLTGYHQFYYGDNALVSADKAALTIDTSDIKAEKTLTLPSEGSVNQSKITWESSRPDIIDITDPKTVKVTLPESKTVVTLTATLKKDESTTFKKPFTITVWSQADVDAETELDRLESDVNGALGGGYKLYPVCGTDKNVLDMVKATLAEKNLSDIDVSIKKVEKQTSTPAESSGIDGEGNITYFYIDPNTTPLQHSDMYHLTLTFTRGSASFDREEVPVIVFWDRSRVEQVMKDEILPQVALPERVANSTKPVTENFDLPKVACDETGGQKRWALISWESNDPAITISTKNQDTADTLFDPYVAEVHGALTEKPVTLTATCTFQFTNDTDGEKAITMSKVFNVTVGRSKEGLQYVDAMDKVFNENCLKDIITGKDLTSDANGIYTVRNDIQLPKTGDMGKYIKGFDGAYTPIVITSDNPDVIKNPDVANVARLEVYRPDLNGEPVQVSFTVKILSRPNGPSDGQDFNSMPVLAEKTFTVSVQPITQEEIDAELALMQQVKEHYWDGIKKANSDKDSVTGDLQSFIEVYEQDGQLVWVRNEDDCKDTGIKAVALDGWYEGGQAWRCFKSSNPDVISHENLLVTRQKENKAVTITSCLTSDRFGRYDGIYPDACFKELSRQIVSASVIVKGTEPTHSGVVSEKSQVSFTLQTANRTWITRTTVYDLPEGTTVFDVFKRVLGSNNYTYGARGSYIYSITSPSGETLGEFDLGENSGWMYKVNGVIVDQYMNAQTVSNRDNIVVFFTKDYTEETGYGHSGGSWNGTNAADKKAAASVDDLISAIGGVKLSSEKDIAAARAAYDKLTDAQKKLVSNYNILTAAEQALADLKAGKLPFTDVKAGAWYADAVKYVFDQGLMSGISAQQFGPDSQVTRGQVVTILWRLAGSPAVSGKTFHDVSASAWYADAVAWASANGVVSGYENGGFGPEDQVTREQLAAILYRYAQLSGKDTEKSADLSGYTDSVTISAWAPQALKWAVGSGLISGTGANTLSPRGTATRAQIAVILQNFCK